MKGNAGKGEIYFKVPIRYFPGETVKGPRQLLAEENLFSFIVARRKVTNLNAKNSDPSDD